MAETGAPTEDRRVPALADYRKTLLQHKEIDAKVRSSALSWLCTLSARCIAHVLHAADSALSLRGTAAPRLSLL